jgi:hypothetical protein
VAIEAVREIGDTTDGHAPSMIVPQHRLQARRDDVVRRDHQH